MTNVSAHVSARLCSLHAALAFVMLIAGPTPGNAADWTPLINLAPNFPGTMILLSDGTVMVQNTSNPSYKAG